MVLPRRKGELLNSPRTQRSVRKSGLCSYIYESNSYCFFVNNNNNNNNMHNTALVLENNIHKLLWDFDINRDHLISARRPDLIIITKNKENLQNCRLYCPG